MGEQEGSLMPADIFLGIRGFLKPLTFIALIMLVLVGNPTLQAQESSRTCETILNEARQAHTEAAYGGSEAETIELPAGAVVRFVGQTPDRSAWILRYEGQYVLYPTTSPDLRPTDCQVPLWGAPPPNYRPLAEVLTDVGVDTWHEAGYFGQGVRVGVLDTRYDGLADWLATSPALSCTSHLSALSRRPDNRSCLCGTDRAVSWHECARGAQCHRAAGELLSGTRS